MGGKTSEVLQGEGPVGLKAWGHCLPSTASRLDPEQGSEQENEGRIQEPVKNVANLGPGQDGWWENVNVLKLVHRFLELAT